MAVIKEKQQFKIGNIGVARASQAATIQGQAVQDSLSALGQVAFERASAYATKVGQEAGQAATVVDPETGMPVALQVPEGFGTVASEAYERVSQTRFFKAVDDEIKVKAFELSQKYKHNRNGAAQYSQAMRAYVKSMETTAEGVAFKSYIKDIGESYHDGTFAEMTARQADRERQEMIAAANDRFSEGLQALEMMTKIHGADSEEVQVLSAQINQGVSDTVNAGLANKPYQSKSQKLIRLAKAQGEIRRIVTDQTSSEDILLINAAIGTQNPGMLPEGYEDIATLITGFGTDLASLNTFESYVTEYLGDIETASKIRENKEAEALKLELAEKLVSSSLDDGALAGETVSTILESVGGKDKAAFAATTITGSVAAILSQANEYEVEGLAQGDRLKIARSQQLRNQASLRLKSAADALINDMVNGDVKLAPVDVKSVIDLLKMPKLNISQLPATLSPNALSYIRALRKLTAKDRDLDGSVKAGIIARFEQLQVAGDLNISQYQVLTPSEAASIENDAFGTRLDVSFPKFKDNLEAQQIELQKLNEAGLTTSAENLQNVIQDSIVAYADGIIRRTTLNLGEDRLAVLRKAGERKNGAIIGGANGKAIDMLRTLENIYPTKGDSNIWTKLESHISTYTLGGAKVRSAQKEETTLRLQQGAATTLIKMSPEIDVIASETDPSKISSNFSRVASEINSIPNLDPKLKESSLNRARVGSAKAAFNNFLATNPNESQLDDFSSYFNGVIDGTGSLTNEQTALIDAAKSYAEGIPGDSDFMNTLTTRFNGGVADAKATLLKQQAAVEFAQDSKRLFSGLLNQADGVVVMDKIVEDRGIDAFLALQDPSYLTTPEGRGLFDLVKRSGVLPSDWSNAFKRIADGGFASMPNLDIETAFSLYENLKSHEYAGMKTESVTISRLSEAQRYTLEFMSLATKSFGVSPQVLTEAFQNAPRMKSTEFTDLMRTTFDIDEDSDLSAVAQEVDGYFAVSAETQRTLQVMTQTFMSRSIQGGVRISKEEVIDYAEQWMKDNRPERGMIDVLTATSGKAGKYVYDSNAIRSQYNLHQTVPGNEDAFVEYAQLVFNAAVSGTDFQDSIEFGPRFKPAIRAGQPGVMSVDRSETSSLRPAGKAKDGSQLYQFVIHDQFGATSALMSNVYVDTPDGSKVVGVAPLYISTNDKGFTNIVLRNAGEYADDVEEKRLKLIARQNRPIGNKDYIPYGVPKPGQGLGIETFGGMGN